MDHYFDVVKQLGNAMIGVVGLTGGIASGKTTVAALFQELGVPIIDADEIARDITVHNAQVREAIAGHFGDNLMNPDGSIDRRKLRELVFQYPRERQWLETLLHPLILEIMENQVKKTKYPYCICAIPLLVESYGLEFIQRILVVHATQETQLKRAMARDEATQEAIEKIIASQTSPEKRLSRADDIIENDGDKASLKKKVVALHQKYLQLYSTPKTTA